VMTTHARPGRNARRYLRTKGSNRRKGIYV
jgi:hypothetical protein